MKEEIGLSESTALSIKDLTFSFENKETVKPIFSGISLEVNAGEFVSVIGASGSGKSTLFKLVAGLMDPSQGQIWIDGQQHDYRLGKVAYMPQQDLLLPWRTILDNVLLPLEISKENNPEKIREIKVWLSRFGLADYEKAYPHELSGGMRQRAAFLRTIMTGKDLLLLDEPFGALDSLTKRKMHRWLLELWGELKKTVLFITHDLEEALLLSDRIYILSTDRVKEVKVHAARPRTSDMIYEDPFIKMRKELEIQSEE